MASRMILRSLRASCPPISSRSYVTQARSYTPAVKAFASTATPGAGNPNIVDTLPSTANEINVEAPTELPLPEVPSGAEVVGTDWSKSYHGLSSQAFSKEIAEVLLAPLDPLDVEMKPDGIIYLPEIKYRRVLNKALGPGGWGLAPRSETNVGPKIVSREYALVCQGRLVAIARGEQEYFDPNGIPTATEACKSNALMRCCKDLGIASELWDPRFIREFKAKHCIEVFAEHMVKKTKKKLWRRKDQPKFGYPWKE
ncbi:mitochondrial genome maintenance MGM101 [Athelia psychrophila]|uniref:Mitochondrial genome maintenance protein MGM101 n=1 Tax=Athelia psychrophila TaxID=1759441 RepID=A0A167XM26_9AGAM|nr:mitochondrial genome maintenance MGM101 [Fibularhizoctonia sp. CBS 109695]